jgi:hypothetical protein
LDPILFNIPDQIELASALNKYKLPEWGDDKSLLYQCDNDFLANIDASLLSAIVQHYKPINMIEIGCGWSTKAILDTRSISTYPHHITCIEPRNYRFKELYDIELISLDVQAVRLSVFEKLQENDILFIDGDHNGSASGGAAWAINEILPTLNVGVIVGWHDIYLGWKYCTPREDGGEQAILRSFISYNNCWRILIWLPMIREHVNFVSKPKPSYNGSMFFIQRIA